MASYNNSTIVMRPFFLSFIFPVIFHHSHSSDIVCELLIDGAVSN